jgi:Ca2+-binding EF-hand superfamily protein
MSLGLPMYRRLLTPALLVAVAASLSACAGGPPPDKGPGWRGGPTHGERLAPVHLFISPSGEPFRGEKGFERWFDQVDTNHDGMIDAAEFRADAVHSFKVVDTNGDGVIDGIELQHYEHDLVPEVSSETFDTGPNGGARPAGGRRGGGGRGGGMGGGAGGAHGPANATGFGPDLSQQAPPRDPQAGLMGAARYSLLNEPEPISAADTDLDGKVTMKEWMAITERRFAKLDHLKTGQLTRDSLLNPPTPVKGAPKTP